MEIVWTFSAIRNVRKIFKFYCKIADKEVATNVIEPIFTCINTIKHSPLIGQQEGILEHLKKGHRYLVHNHFKIIYRIENDTAFITHVFDTRQNPKKLK